MICNNPCMFFFRTIDVYNVNRTRRAIKWLEDKIPFFFISRWEYILLIYIIWIFS